ncbi:hypothetical protein V6N11_021152 [Hibiscus sabdariffa]|uniref:Uncharacterized protein n=2 Tax=Hibiscus sabdariffa TaxID=183260 RepID=A0ABR2AGZ7_9ROSI
MKSQSRACDATSMTRREVSGSKVVRTQGKSLGGNPKPKYNMVATRFKCPNNIDFCATNLCGDDKELQTLAEKSEVKKSQYRACDATSMTRREVSGSKTLAKKSEVKKSQCRACDATSMTKREVSGSKAV